MKFELCGLHCNSIGDNGIRELAIGLQNTILLELDLSCNRIGYDGATVLISTLRFKLQKLDLSYNPIIVKLSEELLSNSVLKDLITPNIGGDVAKLLDNKIIP